VYHEQEAKAIDATRCILALALKCSPNTSHRLQSARRESSSQFGRPTFRKNLQEELCSVLMD